MYVQLIVEYLNGKASIRGLTATKIEALSKVLWKVKEKCKL